MITDDKSPVANIRLISVASSFLHFKYCLALMNIEPRYMFDENVVADISIHRWWSLNNYNYILFCENKYNQSLDYEQREWKKVSTFNVQGWTPGPSLFRVYCYITPFSLTSMTQCYDFRETWDKMMHFLFNSSNYTIYIIYFIQKS